MGGKVLLLCAWLQHGRALLLSTDAQVPLYTLTMFAGICRSNSCILLSGAEEVLNPKIFSAQMAEDHVGRASRICRSVHPRTVSLRTAQKWLVQTKTLFERPLVE